jgi:hypothetical protein
MPTLMYQQQHNNKARDKIHTQRTGHKVNIQNHDTHTRKRKKT